MNRFVSRALCLCLGGFGASVSYGQEVQTLKIGGILPLSGPMAPYGVEVKNGVELALATIKTQNAPLARRLQWKVVDDQSLSKMAEDSAKSLLTTHRVDVLIGSLTSLATQAISRVALDAKRPLIVPTATDAHLTAQNPYAFRASLTDYQQGEAIAAFLSGQLRAKRVAILSDPDSEYAKAMASGFSKRFVADGGEVVSEQVYSAGSSGLELSEQIKAIRQARPQAVVIPGYYPEAAAFLRQAKDAALTVPVIGGDGWDSPALHQLAGRVAVDGHFFITHFSANNPDETVRHFVNAYRERFGKEPTQLAAMGYDAMLLVANALERANNTLPPTILRTLKETNGAPGLGGKMRFGPARHIIKPAMVIGTAASGNSFHARVEL